MSLHDVRLNVRCNAKTACHVDTRTPTTLALNGKPPLSLIDRTAEWHRQRPAALRAAGSVPLHRAPFALSSYLPLIHSAKIQHLAYEVEGNLGGLPYNYQVVGKHPAAGFSSL